MTSLTSYTKQIPANAGYYINVASMATASGAAAGVAKFLVNAGTDALPLLSTNLYATSSFASTLLATAGSAIFKDMGKTLTSSGRVFRKVQLVVSTGTLAAGGSDGVGGVDSAPFNYLTGYIELPGTHGAFGTPGGSTANTAAPVARLG
jgi:hypothetical protein